MSYIRTMKDWTKKIYYSDEEVSSYIKNNIRLSAVWLKNEILQKEVEKSRKFSFSNKEIEYV